MKKNLASGALIHDIYWAIEPRAGNMLLQQLNKADVEIHIVQSQPVIDANRAEVQARAGMGGESADKPYEMADGIALFSINGPMTESPTSLEGGCSTVLLTRKAKLAARDPDVKGGLVRVNSPGGSVAGTNPCAEAFAEFASKKPLNFFISGSCASAAYWVACSGTGIYSDPTGLTGSIGTYMVIEDWSKAYEEAGVRAIVLSTGKYKGAGTQGTEVTPEQLAAWQATVDDLGEIFRGAVARGRNMNMARVEDLADGNIHVAHKAQALGLIDGVSSLDEVLSSMRQGGKIISVGRAGQINDFPSATLPTNVRLEDALDSALIAVGGARDQVKAVTPRVAEVKAIRGSQSRTFSPNRLEQVQDLHEAVGELYSGVGQLRTECEALATTTADQAQAEPASTDPAPLPPDGDVTRSALERAVMDADVVLSLTR